MPPRRVPNFFQDLIEMALEARSRGMLSTINLGGASGAGGGAGQPPGGFLDRLIQGRIAYDTTEDSTYSTGSSPSLVDNLNHIRARLTTLEAGGAALVNTDELQERIWWGW